MRTTRSKRAILFSARGQLESKDGTRACEVRVLAPVRVGGRGETEYSARVKLTAPYRIDQEISGGTAKQARELAFGLVHKLFEGAVLRDASGAPIPLPGASLPPDEDRDDGVRAPLGLVACAVPRDASTVRIVLDDAASGKNGSPGWKATGLFTWIDVDRERFRLFKLTDDEFEAIGAAVVSRLAAKTKLGPPARARASSRSRARART